MACGNEGLVMVSRLANLERRFMSGVASLSTSLRSGDLGVSPLEDAKSSTSSLRGVENKGLFRTEGGRAGSAFGDEKKCG